MNTRNEQIKSRRREHGWNRFRQSSQLRKLAPDCAYHGRDDDADHDDDEDEDDHDDVQR